MDIDKDTFLLLVRAMCVFSFGHFLVGLGCLIAAIRTDFKGVLEVQAQHRHLWPKDDGRGERTALALTVTHRDGDHA